ncbi:hypothetical protein BUALT_Bualt05G0054700 [Buddleja alternifolia]|uniref:Transposase-associated domain-containing protein n=1 Tax=Buddleja alternifolia TaxID=168488 RepID=A0AAV6XGR7_9LAMI|nr:hypothetical protein BUALT_Bualt05G0054700 [Buddleja alternifolia]
MMAKLIANVETRMANQDASIQNLETQMGQLSNLVSTRQQGALPSDTEKNLREMKEITLREGKQLEDPHSSILMDSKTPALSPIDEQSKDGHTQATVTESTKIDSSSNKGKRGKQGESPSAPIDLNSLLFPRRAKQKFHNLECSLRLIMDKSWMRKPRSTKEYERGLDQFLDMAFAKVCLSGKIICPCKNCKNVKWVNKEVGKEHLLVDGFMKDYTNWVAHGEDPLSDQAKFQQQNEFDMLDDMFGLVNDVFGVKDTNLNMEEEPNEQAKAFYKLLDDAQKELYLGCKKISKLAFLVRLFHLKCTGKWSNKSFTMLLELLKEAFPDATKSLPQSYYEVQKIIGALGLSSTKIDACPNDCMLYWKEHENDEVCHVCKTSRYVKDENNSMDEETSSKKQHKTMVRNQNPCLGMKDVERIHSETFAKWFKNYIEGMHLEGNEISEELRALAQVPIDSLEKGWHVVVRAKARDSFDMDVVLSFDGGLIHQNDNSDIQFHDENELHCLLFHLQIMAPQTRSCSTRHGAAEKQPGIGETSMGLNQHGAAAVQPNVNTSEQDRAPIQDESTEATPDISENNGKRVRGPTCMPKVWRQPSDKLVEVSFNDLGQPNDQYKTSTLAHFLGTIARNGRYCPLSYQDWRLMPRSYKDEMLKIVKTKFDLPPGKEPYILKSINKKWRNWKCQVKKLNFDPNIPIEQQMLDIPDRVDEEQYKTLVKHWMSDKSKRISEKNRQTRAQLDLLHRMGKKSFALVKELMKKKLGRYPTRAELFEECYYRADGSPASAIIQEAIEHMKELGEQEPESSNHDCIHNPQDTYAKIMGEDKHGRVRMYGMGVTPADVYGTIPSRDATRNLSAIVHGRAHSGQPDAQNIPLASSNNLRSSSSTSRLSCIRSKSEELGPGWCEIIIQVPIKKDECLFKPYDRIRKIEDAVGAPLLDLYLWLLWMKMRI